MDNEYQNRYICLININTLQGIEIIYMFFLQLFECMNTLNLVFNINYGVREYISGISWNPWLHLFPVTYTFHYHHRVSVNWFYELNLRKRMCLRDRRLVIQRGVCTMTELSSKWIVHSSNDWNNNLCIELIISMAARPLRYGNWSSNLTEPNSICSISEDLFCALVLTSSNFGRSSVSSVFGLEDFGKFYSKMADNRKV